MSVSVYGHNDAPQPDDELERLRAENDDLTRALLHFLTCAPPHDPDTLKVGEQTKQKIQASYAHAFWVAKCRANEESVDGD